MMCSSCQPTSADSTDTCLPLCAASVPPSSPLLLQVTRDVYEELLSRMPPAISWDGLREMERKEGEDHCEYELACSANGCEMVDIV